MKRLMSFAAVGLLLAAVNAANAGDFRFPTEQPVLVSPGFVVANFDAPPAPPEDNGAPPAVAAKPSPDPVSSGVKLYPCVKYVDLKEMAPCAKTMIIDVRDPCQPKPDPCAVKCTPCPTKCTCGKPCHPCATKCKPCKPPVRTVKVAICVPTCQPCPPKVTSRMDGRRVRYDFGKYAVDVRVRANHIEVDYQD